jgi:hypothetical protein
MSIAAKIVENLLDNSEPLDPKEEIEGMTARDPKFGVPTFADIDAFTQQYLETAFWTEEERLREEAAENGLDPIAHDYGWSSEALERAQQDCDNFRKEAQPLLDQAGDDEQNAHDFWLTRNGHGAGFWDRDYPAEVGAGLSQICERYGGITAYLGDDGEIYFM